MAATVSSGGIAANVNISLGLIEGLRAAARANARLARALLLPSVRPRSLRLLCQAGTV